MKNYKKNKISQEDLKKIPPEKILKDLNIVNNVLNKIEKINEDINEPEAEQIKAEVEQIENYLKYQYKDYINADIEGDILEDNDIQNLYDILSDKENLDTEE
jgi:conjugal transfer/entry exclusion protein